MASATPFEEPNSAIPSSPATRADLRKSRHPQSTSALLVDDGPMRPVLEMVDRVAPFDVTVLLQGETGVGKDVVAREIHARSPRASGPFVKVHCAAIPSAILESELFGYESGAFTDAVRRKLGKFELANGGTIFLDEIAEIEFPLQAKLLQVLQERAFVRIGGNGETHCDVRVICASNRSLEEMVAAGSFRQDLFFRVHGFTISVPPLRERPNEILPLLKHFLAMHSRAMRRFEPQPSTRLLALLSRYPFPGNVRELENLARRLVALGNEEAIMNELLRAHTRSRNADNKRTFENLVSEFERTAGEVPLLEVRRRTIREAERAVIERVLVATRCNRKKAAQILGVSYSTLLEKIRSCGLKDVAIAAFLFALL